MALWKPDPTFYPSARMAMAAPPETLAYVVTFNPKKSKPDALCVIDLDPSKAAMARSSAASRCRTSATSLHHFGWNACSAALCPYAPHPHVERRYLVVPGLRSSRIHIIDTKPDRAQPDASCRSSSPRRSRERTGYSRPHTIHCGPDAIYVSALGAPNGDGPGGIFLLDHESFDVLGRWEVDRGPQYLAYDFWWHLGYDVAITSEWGTPNMIENGVNPDLLLGGKYGHALHLWDLRKRRHLQTLDLGAEHQMALELRPAHDPTKHVRLRRRRHLDQGSVGVDLAVASRRQRQLGDSASHRDSRRARRSRRSCRPRSKPFKAVPPLITDINLSLDDNFLYVSCFGTGDLRQYDVSDPFIRSSPACVRLGGIVSHAAHPKVGAAQRRPADARGQPRRQAHLFQQFALRRVGRAVLSRGHPRMGREARRRSRRRP